MSLPKPLVMPRVVLENGDSWPLTDAIEHLLESSAGASLWVCGHQALEALEWARNEMGPAGRLASCKLRLVGRKRQVETVLIDMGILSSQKRLIDFEGWGTDQLIEYLLAKSPEHCSRAMQQITHEDGRVGNGNPELWTRLIDRLIEGAFNKSILELKLEELDASLKDHRDVPNGFKTTDQIAHAYLVGRQSVKDIEDRLPSWTRELLKDRHLRNSIQASYLVKTLQSLATMKYPKRLGQQVLSKIMNRLSLGTQGSDPILGGHIPAEVAKSAAASIAGNEKIRRMLELHLDVPQFSNSAANLLFAMDANWKPPSRETPWYLERASFENANWSRCQLNRCRFHGLNLRSANFERSSLEHGKLLCLDANATEWAYADLIDISLYECILQCARLQHCNMRDGCIQACDLTNAAFDHANLRRCSLVRSKLDGVSYRFANLSRVHMENVTVEGSDFSFANLKHASLRHIDLSTSVFEVTNLSMGRFQGCKLDGLTLNKCRLYRTQLHDCSLTGTRFASLDMRRSDLSNSRLGEIYWTNCDLRQSDLRGCTFHFGSTRCGIVDSPYPSHGTRTGFYSDDLERLYFEEPETVRRGSLQGCDLRGANIEGVDFYLIDLRDAKLDPWQKRQMSATGAILSE